WPWMRNNPPPGQVHPRAGVMNFLSAVFVNLNFLSAVLVNFEHISIALLLGLGIGLLCGELPRRFSAALRGDTAVAVFGAMVGVLGVMTLIPTETVIAIVFSLMISEAVYDRLIQTDLFVLGIVLKALFIGLGATLGGLIGALSSREGARSPD